MSGPAEQGGARVRTPSLAAGLTEANQRVQELLGAAERTATGIIADAEAEARRRLEAADMKAQELDGLVLESTRLLAEVADELVEQSEGMRRRADELQQAVERVRLEAAPADAKGTPRPAGREEGGREPKRAAPPVRDPARSVEIAQGLRASRAGGQQAEAGSLVLRPVERAKDEERRER